LIWVSTTLNKLWSLKIIKLETWSSFSSTRQSTLKASRTKV
jgi:hypothetical protein